MDKCRQLKVANEEEDCSKNNNVAVMEEKFDIKLRIILMMNIVLMLFITLFLIASDLYWRPNNHADPANTADNFHSCQHENIKYTDFDYLYTACDKEAAKSIFKDFLSTQYSLPDYDKSLIFIIIFSMTLVFMFGYYYLEKCKSDTELKAKIFKLSHDLFLAEAEASFHKSEAAIIKHKLEFAENDIKCKNQLLASVNEDLEQTKAAKFQLQFQYDILKKDYGAAIKSNLEMKRLHRQSIQNCSQVQNIGAVYNAAKLYYNLAVAEKSCNYFKEQFLVEQRARKELQDLFNVTKEELKTVKFNYDTARQGKQMLCSKLLLMSHDLKSTRSQLRKTNSIKKSLKKKESNFHEQIKTLEEENNGYKLQIHSLEEQIFKSDSIAEIKLTAQNTKISEHHKGITFSADQIIKYNMNFNCSTKLTDYAYQLMKEGYVTPRDTSILQKLLRQPFWK